MSHELVLQWRPCLLLIATTSCAAPPVGAPPAAPVVVVEPAPAMAPAVEVPSALPPELMIKRLAAVSVRERLPLLGEEHQELYGHVPLAHVAAAVEQAPADMFVTYIANGAETLPIAESTLVDDGHFVPYDEPVVSAGGLSGYGADTLFGYSPSLTGYILLVYSSLTPLRDRSPGLLWSARTESGAHHVTFVSLDGETYDVTLEADGPWFEHGTDPPADWPPVANPVFGRAAFLTSRRAQTAPLAPADAAFEQCTDKAWSRATQAMSPEELAAGPMPTGSTVRSECAKEIGAWERTFAESIEASLEQRTALLDQARARLTE